MLVVILKPKWMTTCQLSDLVELISIEIKAVSMTVKVLRQVAKKRINKNQRALTAF